MTDARLPAHLEVSGLLRAAEAQGGFGMVLAKGERDAGTILVLVLDRGGYGRVYERMPQLDGTRKWTETRKQTPENTQEISNYLTRRHHQDPDNWLIELTIAEPERFVSELSRTG